MSVDKIGSGLLFTSGQEVLLLLRNSKHNDKTWGLPGGNQERGDLTLFDTAQREAREEMGELPSNFRVSREQKVVRGKRNEKHYTVFVCSVDPSVRNEYVPKLNHEHSDWKWVHTKHLKTLELHPVVDKFFENGQSEVVLREAEAVLCCS
mmetsp:Transcript_7840/g.14877  ORF Transcript_7840/g.14877 Transcript_7840/m.14877 type:complete len:150 (+) Transcript_7840:146-595(+)|eukprot:CAMPEP_0114255072 /NCGR_PEP_ID=MMETSP0058-20121206/17353_1 /TAXON_ID=36894 /ORGANISM="Pyramimonas parkeae, CCMP726" /LENGTH=149 /DNA_ID=CAMNT_0001369405 /DNA_START=97 /DNA_END=546 /DNA_ORIENTATION=+